VPPLHDPRPRYDIVQPVAIRGDDFVWMKVGVGYRNADGTIDAYLETIIVGLQFRLRKAPSNESPKNGRAGTENGGSHGA
jgi:hypothetical protein